MNFADHDEALEKASARTMRRVKLSAFTVSALILAGIASLMVLAAGKGEDITGIVAPALLLAVVSGAIGTAAAMLEKRSRH